MTQMITDPPAPREATLEQELQNLLQARMQEAQRYGDVMASAWKVTAQCLAGGKLLRPRLFLGALDALGWRGDPVQAARIGAAIELLHSSLLLHDDVIDGDLLRRGRPNFIAQMRDRAETEAAQAGPSSSRRKRDALHWARSNAILMGNLLLSSTHMVFARASLPAQTRERLLDLLERTLGETVAGEQLDVALSDGIFSPEFEIVQQMSQLKTATYTFELPLLAAAIIAEASPELESEIAEIAARLGTAFQLQDDLLSTFGDAAAHGKDPHSDLREGKETLIIGCARMTNAWPSIAPLFGMPNMSDREAEHLRDLLTACGAEQLVRSLVDDLLNSCVTSLSSPDTEIPQPLAQLLNDFIAQIRERES